MSLTIGVITGDMQATDWWNLNITVPDANGGNLTIEGSIWGWDPVVLVPVGSQKVVIASTSLALPAAPASGTTYVNVQVDVVTGVATLQQSASGDPAAISATSRIVYRTQLTPTTTDPALDPSQATPDAI